ncbi:PLP-dependent cysteine synthase family protein [Haloglycomyces albus]|uniref:PLP-dependent cysteine synthase family protein n=1 Tax=Haloglycomyces albus TaxID=526067 RepID=UPI00046C9F90|nr:pyridoxal-phosphate dependent enzyme [Haloglycomyces albus]
MEPHETVPRLDADLDLRSESQLETDYHALGDRYPAFGKFGVDLGNTSLMEIPHSGTGARVLAKCEWENPERSIKDRVAYALLGDALRLWGERPLDDLRILEYSGGNLSRAIAALSHGLGLRAKVILSDFSPRSLLDDLDRYGVEVELVPKEKGFYEVINTARRIAADDPGWTFLYQHRNPVNIYFHEATTGAETLRQLHGRRPAAWVASIGTGGSLIGVWRALKRRHPDVRAVGVTPAELPYGADHAPDTRPKYAGSGGMGYGVRQPFISTYEDDVEHHSVSYPDCLETMASFFDETGVRIGSSAAANLVIARRIAERAPEHQVVATVFPDTGTPEEWKRLGR